jgi:CP family cyanate transporter-like MFS transporter
MKPSHPRIGAPATALLLLWLLGLSLRITILAIPPVIALIQSDLRLSATAVGLLGSLPAALFALAALPGALLVQRLGLRRTLIIGLALITLGSACRGINAGVAALFVATIVMGAGVAIMQPALPAAVRWWTAGRVGFATAVYTNGLLVAEVIPVVLTLYLLPLLGGWRADLVFWSIPVAIIATTVARLAPRDQERRAALPAASSWWPDWSSGLIWRLALLFVGINSLYFGTNAFLPGVLIATGRREWVGLGLIALNFAQLPASLLLLYFAQRLEKRTWPYVACAVAALLGIVAIVLGDGPTAVVGAGVIGFSAGGGLILALTLPALLAPPEQVARTAAAVFTVSYAGAVVMGVLCGVLWDATHQPLLALVPLAAAALATFGAALTMRYKSELR